MTVVWWILLYIPWAPKSTSGKIRIQLPRGQQLPISPLATRKLDSRECDLLDHFQSFWSKIGRSHEPPACLMTKDLCSCSHSADVINKIYTRDESCENVSRSSGDFIHPITLSRAERASHSCVAKRGPVEEGNHGDAPEMIHRLIPRAAVLPFTQRSVRRGWIANWEKMRCALWRIATSRSARGSRPALCVCLRVRARPNRALKSPLLFLFSAK